MTSLSTFFEESETSFGVFYPRHYIIAAFPSFEAAAAAAQKLRSEGFQQNDVRAVEAHEMLCFLKEMQSHSGIAGSIMTALSRTFDTEATFVDRDVQKAKQGAGFLAVHCPAECEAAKIRDLVQPFGPSGMQWYLGGCVRSLV